VQGLQDLFKVQGLKVALQKYQYEVAGKTIAGENVYAMLKAPRGDATEAIVLMAAWKNMDNILNQSGVALVLTLARYFNREQWNHNLKVVGADPFQAGLCGQRTSSSSSRPTARLDHKLGWTHITLVMIHLLFKTFRFVVVRCREQ